MPLDVGIGLILGVLLHAVTGMDYAYCLLLGVVALLLPDIDFIVSLARKRTLPHSDHRDLMHYPLVFIPTVGFLGLMINQYVGLLFAFGAFVHFLHDSIGIGWGVQWLYPFKRTSYLFLYKAGTPTNSKMPRKLFYAWTLADRNVLMQKYGDPNWISNIYLRLHPYSIVEYLTGLIGIVFALINIP